MKRKCQQGEKWSGQRVRGGCVQQEIKEGRNRRVRENNTGVRRRN